MVYSGGKAIPGLVSSTLMEGNEEFQQYKRRTSDPVLGQISNSVKERNEEFKQYKRRTSEPVLGQRNNSVKEAHEEFQHNKRIPSAPVLSQISENDEFTIQYEAEKLLQEIRAEIKYAESCAEFGDYFSAYVWNWTDSQEDVTKPDDNDVFVTDVGENSTSGAKKDTNENVKHLSISSASSELSLEEAFSRVGGWAQSFERLLSDAVGVRCFQEFLKKEFSEENVLFWVACERFKRTKETDKLKILANDIFRNYISPKAPFLVNVDQVAVKKAEENLNTPNNEMFTIPQEQVFQLMKFDSYNRFLKSELYQECLVAENADRLYPFEDEIEEELRKKPAWVKKSKSSPRDPNNEKKRNLLNFLAKGSKHFKSPNPDPFRKERSSSLGAMEEYNRKNALLMSPEPNGHTPKDSQLWDGLHSKSKSAFVRVILPDGTSTMIVAERGQTIRSSLQEICEQKKFSLQTYDVTVGYVKQVAHLDSDISTLEDNVVFLERRVLFRFDLPNGRSVGIKANPSKSLRDILQPVMKKNGFDIDHYTVHVMNCKVSISLDVSTSRVEDKRLVTKLTHRKLEKQNSDSITFRPPQDIRASFRRLRTNSFKEDKSNRQGTSERDKTDKEKLTHKRSDELYRSEERASRKFGNDMKHFILGRTRSADDDGASALMTVLQKSRSSRLDDQRGLISGDLEVPDFLKVTTTTPSSMPTKALTSVASSKSSAQSSPAKSFQHYPASPVIVDKDIGEIQPTTPDLSLSLNSSINSGRPSLCSFRSWKEMPSPDRELIDKSFMSGDTMNTTLSHDSINSKGTLLEISKSDPALLNKYIKHPVCGINSAPPFSPTYTKDIDELDRDLLVPCDFTSVSNKFPISEDSVWIERDRSRSFDVYDTKNSSKSDLGYCTLPSNRPLPINAFNEGDILRGLEVEGYDVIQHLETEKTLISTPDTPSGSIEPPDNTAMSPGGDLDSSFPDFTPPTPICNGIPKSRSLNGNSPGFVERKKLVAKEEETLSLDVSKSRSAERLGSVDLIDYDLSPRSSQASRGHIFIDIPVTPNKNSSFKTNATPTPEKSKLLKGETIRGRQNEKITFI